MYLHITLVRYRHSFCRLKSKKYVRVWIHGMWVLLADNQYHSIFYDLLLTSTVHRHWRSDILNENHFSKCCQGNNKTYGKLPMLETWLLTPHPPLTGSQLVVHRFIPSDCQRNPVNQYLISVEGFNILVLKLAWQCSTVGAHLKRNEWHLTHYIKAHGTIDHAYNIENRPLSMPKASTIEHKAYR